MVCLDLSRYYMQALRTRIPPRVARRSVHEPIILVSIAVTALRPPGCKLSAVDSFHLGSGFRLGSGSTAAHAGELEQIHSCLHTGLDLSYKSAYCICEEKCTRQDQESPYCHACSPCWRVAKGNPDKHAASDPKRPMF